MNRRLITRVLEKKHGEFLESIDDPGVKRLVRRDSIITGGSIASLLVNEKVKDFDYYFATKETVCAVAEYYTQKFRNDHPDISVQPEVNVIGDRVRIYIKSAGMVSEEGEIDRYQGMYTGGEYHTEIEAQAAYEAGLTEGDDIPYVEKEGEGKYRPVFLSSNAITLSDKVQLVIRFYGNPADIHKNYDFIHCCNYWTPAGGLVLHPLALESLLTKHLSYQGSLYPLCSIIRTRKFIKQGWHINAGQYLKMCFQVSELNLTDVDVLEEQLTGVDAAYFHQVIDYCRKRSLEDTDFRITAPYLVSIVDKIFG
jgi:hypothetical protein